jgi:glycosyltransferase involved in cell wall biosynthesis
MDAIRILAMVEAYNVSGSAKAVLEFAREAAHERSDLPNFDVSILTFDRGQGETALTAAIRDTGAALDVVNERGRFDSDVIPQLRAIVAERRADVIWTNSVKSHFLVRWAGVNRQARWVAFHHGYTATDLKMRLYNQLDRWSLAGADRVVTSSAAFVDELHRGDVSARSIHVQHMPVRQFAEVTEDRRAALRRRLGLSDGTRVLLSVGRLSREKGHADLLPLVPRIRELASGTPLRLVLVGEGPERGRLEELCRKFCLNDCVTLAGQQNDVSAYYSIADAFVLPSHSEGCPNVLLEAMAAGVPVVATAVGGIPEIATDGRDALLVKQGDAQALAAATARLLQDHGLRERLTASARAIVARKTPEAYFQSLASVFRDTYANGRGVRNENRN